MAMSGAMPPAALMATRAAGLASARRARAAAAWVRQTGCLCCRSRTRQPSPFSSSTEDWLAGQMERERAHKAKEAAVPAASDDEKEEEEEEEEGAVDEEAMSGAAVGDAALSRAMSSAALPEEAIVGCKDGFSRTRRQSSSTPRCFASGPPFPSSRTSRAASCERLSALA